MIDPEPFWQIERRLNCYDFSIDECPVWELCREEVYNEILSQQGVGEAHSTIDSNLRSYIDATKLLAKNTISRNPLFRAEHRFLFYGHQRRVHSDTNWVDPYCDPMYRNIDLDYLHLENHHNLVHHQPPETEKIAYTDIITIGGALFRTLGLSRPTIEHKDCMIIERIEDQLNESYEVSLNLKSIIRNELHIRNTTLPFFERILNKIDPCLAVVVVGYGKKVFIEACKKLSIPVVELQHGVIYDRHFGYSHPGIGNCKLFPDYLFTWGEFWGSNAPIPLPDDRIFPIGFPYLEESHKSPNRICEEGNNQLLIISQGTIASSLSKFAVQLNNDDRITMDIVYKLHPGEFDRWRSEYPWLTQSDLEVVEDSPSLYDLFTESSHQLGVYSTALFEGMWYGLDTFIYECDGHQMLDSIIQNGDATLISDVDDAARSVNDGDRKSVDTDIYFKPVSTLFLSQIGRAHV